MTIKALYPNVRPTLNLDFAKTKALDPRITFTRASTATFVGADGLIQTAASGAARFDHNPATGESLGLLVEEARTNLTLYSGDFSQAHWSKFLLSIFTANTIIAPDGTLTGSFIAFQNATSLLSSAQGLQPNTAISPGTNTLSCFAKIGTARYLALGLTNNSGETSTAVFDLQTGTVNGAGSHPFFTVNGTSMVNVGAGWYRCSLTSTYAAGMASHISSSTSGLSGLYGRDVSGNGTSGIYVWGAQVEAGSFPTSYIPTTSSTVTRAADVASMTGTNFSSWFNSGVGTFFTDSSNDQLTSNIARSAYNQFNTVAFSLGSGSGRVYTPILAYLSNNTIFASLFQFNGGGTDWGPALQNTISNTANVRKVAVFTDTTNNVAGLCTAGQINVASKPVDPTRTGMLSYSLAQSMVIGYNSDYYGNYMGRIKRLAYYPARLTDTQLQALTAT